MYSSITYDACAISVRNVYFLCYICKCCRGVCCCVTESNHHDSFTGKLFWPLECSRMQSGSAELLQSFDDRYIGQTCHASNSNYYLVEVLEVFALNFDSPLLAFIIELDLTNECTETKVWL